MMTNSYSLVERRGKYTVSCTHADTGKTTYLMSVQGSGTVWYFDPDRARYYSQKAALRHLRNLRASDPYCEEDC